MACRSCSKSGLGLLSRSSRLSLLESNTHTTSVPRIPSSSRPASSLLSSTTQTRQQPQTRRLHTARQCQRPEKDGKEGGSGGISLSKLLRAAVGGANSSTASTYAVYGLTEKWAKLCAAQADYVIGKEDRREGRIKSTEEGEEVGVTKGSVWHDEFHLLPTFSTWSQVSMLHMYLLVVRFRCLDKEAHEKWQKQLVDHFFHQAEAKMDVVHDLGSSSIRQRYLKDLFVQWRGVILAYDEGLVKGDAVLASAVWRNLFKAREDVDVRVLAAIVGWMRSCLKVLDRVEDDELPMIVESLFVDKKPSLQLDLVDGWSNMMPEVAGQIGAAAAAAAANGEGAEKKSTSRFT